MYVVCGPFACHGGTDPEMGPPDISIDDSPVCAGWDPTLEIQVGLIDNDVFPDTDTTNNVFSVGATTTDGDETMDDGIDVAG